LDFVRNVGLDISVDWFIMVNIEIYFVFDGEIMVIDDFLFDGFLLDLCVWRMLGWLVSIGLGLVILAV